MSNLSASNLVSFIGQLSKSVRYGYINSSTKSLIKIIDVVPPEGPIFF